MAKLQIRSWINGSLLYEGEAETLKDFVATAAKNGANLDGANLDGANLDGANLDGANLYGANLTRANLDGANLDGANLYGANLYGAKLDGANLYGANLTRANLDGANLDGANLDGAAGFHPAQVTPLLMLLDQPGPIRAYKMVTKSLTSPIQRVGGLTYKIGKGVAVENANCDVNEQCAAGINLATLDWVLKNWQYGCRVLIAEFTAQDIAAIPTNNDGKFRVHRCTIVGEKDMTDILAIVHPKKDGVSVA